MMADRRLVILAIAAVLALAGCGAGAVLPIRDMRRSR